MGTELTMKPKKLFAEANENSGGEDSDNSGSNKAQKQIQFNRSPPERTKSLRMSSNRKANIILRKQEYDRLSASESDRSSRPHSPKKVEEENQEENEEDGKNAPDSLFQKVLNS